MSLPARPAYTIYRWLWTGFDWLYPPECGGCGQVGLRWCAECQAATQNISSPFCRTCGATGVNRDELCNRCLAYPPNFSALRSWTLFAGPVRNAIHRLKYQRDIALGEVLARPLIQMVVEEDWDIDLIVPVPLSVARKIERGYNQAALLARPIALATGWSYQPRAMQRTKETRSQVGLTLKERYSNVSGAFLANRKKVSGKHVLLIDDVTTSGATLEACSQALRTAGALEVYCLTIARVV